MSPESRVRVDWRRLRAVVLESDDWGLCAWVPDQAAHEALAGTPAFRTPAGLRYGRSTLESAADVRALRETLLEFRGGDEIPPVWQANTVVAAPDYEWLAQVDDSGRLRRPLPAGGLPLIPLPRTPRRWERPGMWDEVETSIASGVWWPEAHGLHHLPEGAWLEALGRGDADAVLACGHASPICAAVEASAEYAAGEPCGPANLERAAQLFARLFGHAPRSLCPPDYRLDAPAEAMARRLGFDVLQGGPERGAGPVARLARRLEGFRFPRLEDGARGPRLLMPPRIAFEPRGSARSDGRTGSARALRAARAAWGQNRPAVISTHRLNYAHLDAAWSAAGRAALRDLLAGLRGDGAIFLTDAEVRDLAVLGWSWRALGAASADGVLVRNPAGRASPLRLPAPAGARALQPDGGRADTLEMGIEGGQAVVRLGAGETRFRWVRS